MSSRTIVVCLFVAFASRAAAAAATPGVENERTARFFGYKYTSTKIVPQMVTSLVPSSCVQVEASLPPCRSVRKLEEFPRFLGGRVVTTDVNGTVDPAKLELMDIVESTQLGWGEYLGLYAPTVTVNAIYRETTTMLDPRTVVTFSVKGCKPSRLPMDLEMCKDAIEPTPTTERLVTTTVLKDINQEQSLGVPSNNIQGSETSTEGKVVDEATQALT